MQKIIKKIYHSTCSWMYPLIGKRPWKLGYVPYKFSQISRAINNENLKMNELPVGYGHRLDERIVEYPWFLKSLPKMSGKLLDAGSILNYAFLLDHANLTGKNIFISTLAPESDAFWHKGVSYIYEDLRNSCFKNDYFDWITSLSTIEHIGLDNTMLYTSDEAKRENDHDGYLAAILEFKRVLKPGGKLYLSMPYGNHVNRGWFQIFNAEMVSKIKATFSPTESIEQYFQYTEHGWINSSSEAAKNATYFDIHTEKKYGSDFAAASRAIVCLELTK
jgi:SAM-dependent methyltransferase